MDGAFLVPQLLVMRPITDGDYFVRELWKQTHPQRSNAIISCIILGAKGDGRLPK